MASSNDELIPLIATTLSPSNDEKQHEEQNASEKSSSSLTVDGLIQFEASQMTSSEPINAESKYQTVVYKKDKTILCSSLHSFSF